MAAGYSAAGVAQAGVAGAVLTVPLPNSYKKWDIAVLAYEHANQPLSAAPTGWTAITSGSGGTAGATTAIGLQLYWKRLTASTGMTGATVTVPAGADHGYARIFTFEFCVVTGTPYDTPAVTNDTVSNTTVSWPSVTTTVANACVALFSGNNRDAISQAMGVPTNAALTGISENTDDLDNTGNGGGVSVATGTKTAAGATGTSSATATAAQQETTITVAFKPETASANLPPTITGGAPSKDSTPENQSYTSAVYTSDKAVTWSLGGADAALATLNVISTTQCTFTITAKDFEALTLAQKQINLSVIGTTAAALTDTKAATIYVENVHEDSTVPAALMTGWKFASSGVSTALGGAGLTAWATPANIVSDNNAVATFNAGGGGSSSEFLRATGFGFTAADVPDGATILGIEFLVGRTNSGTIQPTSEQLYALKGAAGTAADRAGTNKSAEDYLQAAEDADLFGDANDLWGTTWTPAEVRAAAFGLEYQSTFSSSQIITVDYVQARIIYSPPTRRKPRDCRCA
jgi:hypothetical protein